MNENCHFFWDGPFSQWYKSKFIFDGVEYNCAEQAMMHQKALMFDDLSVAAAIMKLDSPKDHKEYGRKVANFNQEIWDQKKYDLILKINIAKFEQNEQLKESLISTKDNVIAEASPYDLIWGIGLSEEQAKDTPIDQWEGKNLLGKALMETRTKFISATEETEQV